MKNFLEKETFSRLIFRMLDDTLLIRNGFHAQINLQRLLNGLNGIDRRRSTHNNKNNVCSLGVCRHVGRQRGIANKNLSLVSSDRDIRMTLARARPCFPRTSLLSITSVFPPRKYLLPVSRISSNTRSTLETTNSSGRNRDAIKRWKISSSHVCHALLYRREINENFYFFINANLLPSSTPTRSYKTIFVRISSIRFFPRTPAFQTNFEFESWLFDLRAKGMQGNLNREIK